MVASEDETSATMDEIGESLLYTAPAGAHTADKPEISYLLSAEITRLIAMSSRSRLLPVGDREANHNRGPWRLQEGNRVEIGTKAHKGEEIVSDREDWLLCSVHREREC